MDLFLSFNDTYHLSLIWVLLLERPTPWFAPIVVLEMIPIVRLRILKDTNHKKKEKLSVFIFAVWISFFVRCFFLSVLGVFRYNESDCDFYDCSNHKMNLFFIWNMLLLKGALSNKCGHWEVGNFWCCRYLFPFVLARQTCKLMQWFALKLYDVCVDTMALFRACLPMKQVQFRVWSNF